MGVTSMTALKIIAFLLGLAFLLCGYFIRFRGKYRLINGFEDDHRSGRRDESYARKVGTVEFVLGLILLAAALLLMIFA